MYERVRGDICDGELRKALGQQVVDQGGCAAAHISDMRVGGEGACADVVERGIELWTEPADGVGRFILVDVVPMRLVAHGGSSEAGDWRAGSVFLQEFAQVFFEAWAEVFASEGVFDVGFQEAEFVADILSSTFEDVSDE